MLIKRSKFNERCIAIGFTLAGLIISYKEVKYSLWLLHFPGLRVASFGITFHLFLVLIVSVLCLFYWLNKPLEGPLLPALTWFGGQCAISVLINLELFYSLD